MKRVLLTASLALLSASPSGPTQAISSSASRNGTVQRKTKAVNDTRVQPQLATKTQTSSDNDAATKERETNSAEDSISVSKLPVVTVSPPKRDWADWGYWAFNLLLVIVGILQVILLRVTWKTLQRQVQLQEFNQQQWMDIGDWEVEEDKESGDPLTIDLSFSLFNSTPIPITLRSVETTVSRFPTKPLRGRPVNGKEETFLVTENLLLPPSGSRHRSSYSCLVPVGVPNAALTSYRKDGLWLSIQVNVVFLAADGKEKPQWFHQLALCRPNKIVLYMPKGAIPEKTEKGGVEADSDINDH